MTLAKTEIDQILRKLPNIKVLVIGDIMLDHYIWGDASRISPEAPVPVVSVDHHTYTAGGAANVALNLTALGCETEVCGVYGIDDTGMKLTHILHKHGATIDESFSFSSVPTITKSRVVVRQQQLCRLDNEAPPQNYQLDESLLPLLEAKIAKVQAIIFSDYAKGVLNPEIIKRLTAVARKYNCLVAMDPKPRRSMHFKDLDLITPNQKESLELAGITLEPHEEFPQHEVCKIIKEKYNPKYLVITLGAKGMLLCEDGNITNVLPTYAREVFDVSGAGDTVIATLTACLAAGASLEDAAHIANTAAGIVVSKLGTATVTPAEILSFE